MLSRTPFNSAERLIAVKLAPPSTEAVPACAATVAAKSSTLFSPPLDASPSRRPLGVGRSNERVARRRGALTVEGASNSARGKAGSPASLDARLVFQPASGSQLPRTSARREQAKGRTPAEVSWRTRPRRRTTSLRKLCLPNLKSSVAFPAGLWGDNGARQGEKPVPAGGDDAERSKWQGLSNRAGRSMEGAAT